MRKILAGLVFFGLFMVAPVQAQFGKNQVMWEKTSWKFYQSEHFDYYLSLDVDAPEVQVHMQDLVAHLEGSYAFLSTSFNFDLTKRAIVLVSRTHSQFEALRISGDSFMPEGVGAYAFPREGQLLPTSDLVLVVKPDFLPVLNRTIYTHELTHIFQFNMLSRNILQRAVGSNPVDGWVYEATADYMANLYAPYSRDDIRKMTQRIAAANTKNTETGLPTLQMLEAGYADPYSLGAMVFQFLEARYGQAKVKDLIADTFKNHKYSFIKTLENLSNGEFRTREIFDRKHREFWAGQYAKSSLESAQPYSDTPNAKGRQINQWPHPYPMLSPVVMPDGSRIAFLTYSRKNGEVLALLPALPREDPPYVPLEQRKQLYLFGQKIDVIDQQQLVRVLTNQMPPKPYENITAQLLNTWPFNGKDVGVYQDAVWAASVKEAQATLTSLATEVKALQASFREIKESAKKTSVAEAVNRKNQEIKQAEKNLQKLRQVRKVSLVAFFARKNRDHALFIWDANTGKKIKDIEIPAPLDQAFSPAFSSDGKTIYFSAAKNINRDIYSLNLETRAIKNLTNGGVFNSAPAVSPDGTKLAYVAFIGDFQKLFLLDLATGAKQQLTYGRFNDNSPSWSSDGLQLVYTSDEKNSVWNLYTLNLSDMTSRQWTNVFGGVFTPSFMPGENDRVVYTGFFEEDQYQSFIYPNFKMFDARLKEPIRTVQVQPSDQNMQLAVRVEQAVGHGLDKRQLEHKQNPPERWRLSGRNVYFSTSSYYGASIFTAMKLRNLLGTKDYDAFYAKNGDLNLYEFSYVNQSHRLIWAADISHSQYPLYFNLYDYEGHLPRYVYPNGNLNQLALTNVWATETSGTFYAAYPFSKWDRVELGVRPRKRNFLLPFDVPPDQRDNFVAYNAPQDVQTYDFFKAATGQTTLGLSSAFVHDTVLYSGATMGPLHGSAIRLQGEYGFALNAKSGKYATGLVDARKYFRLTDSIVFATRVAGMTSTRPTGDFMLLGGSDTLRSYPYASVAGNQVAYGSAELRFPLPGVYVLGVPVRGVLFGDYATARFSNDLFPTRKEWSYGFGFRTWVLFPMNFNFARTGFDKKKFRFDFTIGLPF